MVIISRSLAIVNIVFTILIASTALIYSQISIYRNSVIASQNLNLALLRFYVTLHIDKHLEITSPFSSLSMQSQN